jgi:hypothetical protein
MRWPRVRFTIRWVLVAVTVVGVALAYRRARERWAVFRDRAHYHAYVEEISRTAVDARGLWYKAHPEIEHCDPEPPPLSPYDNRS